MVSPSPRRALIALRSDAATKAGGDVDLLTAFGRRLADAGCDIITHAGVPSAAQVSGSDVVITANLDRPIEPAATTAIAARAGVPALHYSLHHPYAGVAAYLERGSEGGRRILARLARHSPQRYEQLLWSLHVAVALGRQRKLLPRGRVDEAQHQLLRSARIVVCSAGEAAAIRSDIGPLDRYEIVPHLTSHPDDVQWNPVEGRVIVPGRFESRKNQLLAVALAQRFPSCQFWFIGAALPSNRRYVQRLEEAVARLDNCHIVEPLPSDEFYALLATAAVVFSASWFEVTSLIELAAADIGIPLAVSRYSYLEASGATYRFDPASEDEAGEALGLALEAAGAGRSSILDQSPGTPIEQVVDDLVEART